MHALLTEGATVITAEDRRRPNAHDAAQTARRLILEQHTELRRLLALALVQTYAPSRDRQSSAGALRALVSRIRTLFVQHIADEEAVLLPLFDHEPRARILRAEHARQRADLDGLCALSEDDAAVTFADRFDVLARALLTDIAEEERELAIAVSGLEGRVVGDVTQSAPP